MTGYKEESRHIESRGGGALNRRDYYRFVHPRHKPRFTWDMVHPSVKINSIENQSQLVVRYPIIYLLHCNTANFRNESWIRKIVIRMSVMILQIECKYRQNISLEFLRRWNKQLASNNWKTVPVKEKVQTNDSSVCITR